MGSYLRKHAVSPKNLNIKEYEMLLNTYKALFMILDRDYKGASQCLDKAADSHSSLANDVVKYPS